MAKTATLPAGRFKATCLAVLDQVAETGNSVVVTKRGKPVAVVSPVAPAPRTPLRGSILEEGDLLTPLELDWNGSR